jgi:alginate O-acetyltransferase complex protein AlgI
VLFNSWTYAVFLAAVLALFWSLPHGRARELLLLAAGYAFYMAWHPPYGLLLAALTLHGYAAGLALGRFPGRRRLIVAAGCAGPLAALAWFKYAGFLAGALGAGGALPRVVLPLAISFFTFEVICYVVDVARGLQPPVRDLPRFALFLAFFPKLVAGPILRPREFFPQLDALRPFDRAAFAAGAHRFLVGLVLKVGVADTLAPYVAEVYARPEAAGFASAWAATYAFAVQILGDFSGYTAMAIGSALMLGFRLPENFDAPYLSGSLTDFWRRWHMTLSRWLRDYVYIPLGGSRGSEARTAGNLMITMALGGLWHGAGWTFIAWGTLHGAALVGHKLWRRWDVATLPTWLGALLTFHAVCLGWVFFRAPTFTAAGTLLGRMLGGSAPGAQAALGPEGARALWVVALFFAAHAAARLLGRRAWTPEAVALGRAAVACVAAVVLLAAARPPQPFIYFQF